MSLLSNRNLYRNHRSHIMSLENEESSSSSSRVSPAQQRLDAAAVKATALIQRYAQVEDPYATTADNPWNDPDQIFERLSQAREELAQAWKELEQEHRQETPATTELDPERCRALYVDMITDAFADTLETMRANATKGDQGDDSLVVDVDVLVDCLQSGLDLLTTSEQEELLLMDSEEQEAEEQGGEMTAHQAHRRKLGLDVSV